MSFCVCAFRRASGGDACVDPSSVSSRLRLLSEAADLSIGSGSSGGVRVPFAVAMPATSGVRERCSGERDLSRAAHHRTATLLSLLEPHINNAKPTLQLVRTRSIRSHGRSKRKGKARDVGREEVAWCQSSRRICLRRWYSLSVGCKRRGTLGPHLSGGML